MAGFTCQICGGSIKMQANQTGICQQCGMEYDIDAIRAMADVDLKRGAQTVPTPASKSVCTPANDDISRDASSVLAYYAMISTNKDGSFNEAQKLAADVNTDGHINAVDASNILAYYAYLSTTKENTISLEEYIDKRRRFLK